jgi:hypothetical protein
MEGATSVGANFAGEHRACPERSRMGGQPVLFGSLPKSLVPVVGKLPALPGETRRYLPRVPPDLTNNSALALFDEVDDLRDLFVRWQFLSHRLERLTSIVLRAID